MRTGIDKMLNRDELAGLLMEGAKRLEADPSLREVWRREGETFLRRWRRPQAERLAVADIADKPGAGKMYH